MREKLYSRIAAFPIGKGLPSAARRSWLPFGAAKPPLLFAFPFGEGRPRNGARVLSLMAHLRRSFLLFFIPLEPYPARFARHLPHAGKALCRGYCFFTHACIRSDDMGIALLSYRSLPHWGKGTAQRRSGALVNDALETIFPALFHTASPIQPPPLRGTSFHRKEGVSTRAPSLGRGCRAQRGGVGFLLGRHSGVLVNCRL